MAHAVGHTYRYARPERAIGRAPSASPIRRELVAAKCKPTRYPPEDLVEAVGAVEESSIDD